jgi:hypothetical protein
MRYERRLDAGVRRFGLAHFGPYFQTGGGRSRLLGDPGNNPPGVSLYVVQSHVPQGPPSRGQPMKTRSMKPVFVAASLGLMLLSTAANAAELRVRCEQRPVPSRAKISVDAKNLAQANAMYSVRVISGSNQSTHVSLTAGRVRSLIKSR